MTSLTDLRLTQLTAAANVGKLPAQRNPEIVEPLSTINAHRHPVSLRGGVSCPNCSTAWPCSPAVDALQALLRQGGDWAAYGLACLVLDPIAGVSESEMKECRREEFHEPHGWFGDAGEALVCPGVPS